MPRIRTDDMRFHDLELAIDNLREAVQWTIVRFGKTSDAKDSAKLLARLDLVKDLMSDPFCGEPNE